MMERAASGAVLRPQAYVLTLLGRHLQGRQVAVSSSTFIAVLERLGVGEDATRSTLSRMVGRGHLERHREGRQVFYGVTPRTGRLLAEGHERIFEEPPVRAARDPGWTLLSFSIPEANRDHRHALRVALAWRGFGLLRDGLWIAAGTADVTDLVEELGLAEHVAVFAGRALPPTDEQRVVRTAWDTDRLAASYEGFLATWSDGGPSTMRGPLAAQIRLITEWRLLLGEDPHLPAELLPAGWRAVPAHELFVHLHHQLSPPAEAEFEALLEALPLDGSN